MIDVLQYLRLHVCVQYGGQGTLVLAVLGHQIRRDRDGKVRVEFECDLARTALMSWIDVGVEKGDRERFDPVVDQRPNYTARDVLVEWLDHLPVGSHPLRHAVRTPQ